MSDRQSDSNPEEMPMGTKPVDGHEWLQNLVGDWQVESEMWMGPDQPIATSKGTEKVVSFGGLWALGEGRGEMPNGETMEYRSGMGYDVSFKAYKAFWIASVSSHLWKYDCELSEDGKKMTMNCVGPDMMKDEGTANYRDIIELIDENHRTLTSYGQGEDGRWQQFMKASYTRI